MDFFYTFLVAFMLVFFSELGDKTQLLVLSFSAKFKAINILIGVAIGTFFSHGLAIIFGSSLNSFFNETFTFYSKIFTYLSFLAFGIYGFIPKKANHSSSSFLKKISNSKMNYILIVAFNIMLGELGDKTFLASLGLGLQYPNFKISLIVGAIVGMIASNSIALFFCKLLGSKLNTHIVELLSNTIFIIFGLIGFCSLFVTTQSN